VALDISRVDLGSYKWRAQILNCISKYQLNTLKMTGCNLNDEFLGSMGEFVKKKKNTLGLVEIDENPISIEAILNFAELIGNLYPLEGKYNGDYELFDRVNGYYFGIKLKALKLSSSCEGEIRTFFRSIESTRGRVSKASILEFENSYSQTRFWKNRRADVLTWSMRKKIYSFVGTRDVIIPKLSSRAKDELILQYNTSV